MYSFWKVCWLGFTSNQKQFKLGSIFDMRTGPSNNNVLYYYYRHCENSSNYKYEGTDDTAVTPKRCEKHYAEGIGSGSVGQIPYYLFTQSGNWNNPQRSGISYDCMPYPGTKNKDRNAYGYRITDKNSGKKCGEQGQWCMYNNRTCGKPVEKELDNNNMIEHIESGINAKKLRTYSIGKHCAIQANQCSDQGCYLIVGHLG